MAAVGLPINVQEHVTLVDLRSAKKMRRLPFGPFVSLSVDALRTRFDEVIGRGMGIGLVGLLPAPNAIDVDLPHGFIILGRSERGGWICFEKVNSERSFRIVEVASIVHDYPQKTWSCVPFDFSKEK